MSAAIPMIGLAKKNQIDPMPTPIANAACRVVVVGSTAVIQGPQMQLVGVAAVGPVHDVQTDEATD